MTQRTIYLAASAFMAIALAAPGSVSAQSDQNGGGREHRQHTSEPGGQGKHQPADRKQDQPEQRSNPGSASKHDDRGIGRRDVAEPARAPVQQSNSSPAHGQDRAVQHRTDQTPPSRLRQNPVVQRRAENQAQFRPSNRPAEVQRLRRNMQAQRHYRIGTYHAPRGYAQRRWGYGDRLPNSYYARNYWIGTFLIYSLFAPPSGLVWVRVGDDAYLVDEYSGEIIQARYGIFY